MRLVLFDIDGTLLWTDGAGRRAIQRALLDEMGTAGPIEQYRIDAVCRRYVALLAAELAPPSPKPRLLPGVPELLAALEPHEAAGRALVGLLTGNVEGGAALKLRAAGLDPSRFAVGAYGSDSARRPDLPAIAAERAARGTGKRFTGADIVIVGDTPDDVACGRPIGARVVAVATGFYDVAQLRATGATHVFATLADTAAVLDAIFA